MVLDRLAELLGAGALAAEGRTPLDDSGASRTRASGARASGPAPLTRVARRRRRRPPWPSTSTSSASSHVRRARPPSTAQRPRPRPRRARRSHQRAVRAFLRRKRRRRARPRTRSVPEAAIFEMWAAWSCICLIGSATRSLRWSTRSPASNDSGRSSGLTGEPEADAAPHRSSTLSSSMLGSAEHSTTKSPFPPTVVSAPDAPGEVREAMRIIAAELEAGRPLHRIGVVYRLSEPYAQLLDEELTAAGIPMHGPSVRTLAQTVDWPHASRCSRTCRRRLRPRAPSSAG